MAARYDPKTHPMESERQAAKYPYPYCMQEDRTFEKKEIKYAPPVRSEKKIGNTTFIVNSFFPEQAKDGVVSKIERLIKDEVRKKAITT